MPACLLDVNVWLALAFSGNAGHAQARDWFGSAGNARFCFCRATEQGFLRLASHPILLRDYAMEGNTNRDALEMLRKMQAREGVVFKDEPAGLSEKWRRSGAVDVASPNLWMDAYLAAFAICGGFNLVTFDAGFRRYEKEGLELTLLKVSKVAD